MDFKLILFYLLATMIVGSSLVVISARNPVRAVLNLVFAFVASAVVWMLNDAEFLSLSLVLVYVGAVMVLFLFVVMMLDVHIAEIKSGFIRYLPLGILIGLATIGILVWILGPKNFGVQHFPIPAAAPEDYNNIKELGLELFSNYVYPFEIAGAILIVAIIAAISLVYRGPKQRKSQNISAQVKVRKQDRLKIVKMPSEVESAE